LARAARPPAPKARLIARRRARRRASIAAAVASIALLGAAFAVFVFFRGSDASRDHPPAPGVTNAETAESPGIAPPPPTSPIDSVGKKSFDRTSTSPAKPPARDPEPYVETARFAGHTAAPSLDVAISPDGRFALSGGEDGAVRFWEIETRRELRRFAHDSVVWSVAFSPDGHRALSASHDLTVGLWDLTTGRQIFRKAAHENHVKAVAFFPDGRHALSGGDDDAVILWDLQSSEPVTRVIGRHEADVQCLAISRDGRLTVSGGDDRVARVWDCGSWKERARLQGHKESILTVAFSPDGRQILTGSVDKEMILWDLESREERFRLSFPGKDIPSAAVFLADGRHVMAAGDSGQLAMWDFDSRTPVRQGDGPSGHVGVAALPDGGGVLTSDKDGVVRIWSASRSIARARELTRNEQIDAALSEYGKAIQERPGDVRLQIERGRWLAVLGRSSEADIDFARAAGLAPDNPQLFLEWGWWVAGPYPKDFESAAFESDPAPDPSKPLPIAGNEPRRWQTMPTGLRGDVDMGAVLHAENIAGYALAIVYSTTRRDVVLLVGTDDSARIWQKGKLVLDSPGYTPPGQYVIAATLEPGRNAFLAKVVNGTGGHGLHLRISEEPADFARSFARDKKWAQAADAYTTAVAHDPANRDADFHQDGGQALAEVGRWKEAAAAFDRLLAIDPGRFDNKRFRAHCYLALHDLASYRRFCEAAIRHDGKTQDKNLANNLVWQAALIPNAVGNYTEIVSLGSKLMNVRPTSAVFFNTFGAILYRAGQYKSALTHLQLSIDAQKGNGNAFDFVLMAMARHKLKQPDSRTALDRAMALSKSASMDWIERVEIGALLEEAKLVLELPAPL